MSCRYREASVRQEYSKKGTLHEVKEVKHGWGQQETVASLRLTLKSNDRVSNKGMA